MAKGMVGGRYIKTKIRQSLESQLIAVSNAGSSQIVNRK
jgi:hypothetical protein